MSQRQFRLGPLGPVVLAVTLVVGGPTGCRPAVRADTGKLEQAFQGADATVKADVVQAAAAVNRGDLQSAVTPLKRAIQSGTLDEPQKGVISKLVTDMQMVITQHPGKYSVDLYNAVSDLTAYLDGREPMVKQ
jgi:hypothetical protein